MLRNEPCLRLSEYFRYSPGMHAVGTSVAVSILALSSCAFDGSNSANPSSSDANPQAPDASTDASTADSGPTFDGSVPCEFPLEGVCMTGGPDDGWNVTSNTSLDTDASGTGCRDFAQGACLVFVESFSVSSGATLQVTGTRPLLIASMGDILIDGTIDVSSYRGVDGLGAGANHATCAHESPPEQDLGGAGGAAGGSFAGAGGDGGEGDTNENGGADGKADPGIAGSAVSEPLVLRGGCPGGAGADEGGDQVGLGGTGGGSGGAVWLYAAGDVHLPESGLIRATGAGGNGGQAQSGGGGGGTGGMIVLQGTGVIFAGDLVANGGGGGEGGVRFVGGTVAVGNPGQDGRVAFGAADGGSGASDFGGNGGDGSSESELDGSTGDSGGAGGGGGGGAAGYILLRGSISGGGDSSPPARQN